MQCTIVRVQGSAENEINRFQCHQRLSEIGLGKDDRSCLLDWTSAGIHMARERLATAHGERVLFCDPTGPSAVSHSGVEAFHVELVLMLAFSLKEEHTFTEIGIPCIGPITSPVFSRW